MNASNELEKEEEFINIEDLINNNQIIKLYQFQISDNSYIIKFVAETHKIPEIIIKENFGIDNSFSLYSFVYDIDEINNNTCLPLIKLVKINGDGTKCIYSLCINYNQSNYNQSNYNQSNYNQSNYNQSNYNQSNYNQSNYNQSKSRFDVDKSNNEFTIFFVNAINEKIIDSFDVPKNINSENIVETLLIYVVYSGTVIYD
jgi:hypothetical protein